MSWQVLRVDAGNLQLAGVGDSTISESLPMRSVPLDQADDVIHLLAARETLAECILKDPGAQGDNLNRQVASLSKGVFKLSKQ
jgi:hypothetical protein